MDNIRVAVWGFGAMGGGIARVLLDKKGVEITGVCDIHPQRVGRSIFELLNVELEVARVFVEVEELDAVGVLIGLESHVVGHCCGSMAVTAMVSYSSGRGFRGPWYSRSPSSTSRSACSRRKASSRRRQ